MSNPAKKRSALQRLALLPIAPFAFLVAMIGMVCFLLFVALIAPFAWVGAMLRERKWRSEIKRKGRFLPSKELRPKLDAGHGTLIEETGHKGPYHIWWTEDDILAKGSPVLTVDEFLAILQGKDHPFNSYCLKEYLDATTGTAFLTEIPPRYARSDGLRRMFPQMQVARVVRPFGDRKAS